MADPSSDFTADPRFSADPRLMQIIQQALAGKYSPQDVSGIATQITQPTYERMLPDAQPGPGATFLTQKEYTSLLPYIGSQGFSGADPVPTFSPGPAETAAFQAGQPVFTGFGGPDMSPQYAPAPPQNFIDAGASGADLNYLMSHGFPTGTTPDAGGPDPLGFVTSFGLSQIGREIGGGTGTAADVLGTIGQIGGEALFGYATGGYGTAALGAAEAGNALSKGDYPGAVLDTAAAIAGAYGGGAFGGGGGAAEGAAAGGTLGEAGTSFTDAAAIGSGSGAAGDIAGGAAEAAGGASTPIKFINGEPIFSGGQTSINFGPGGQPLPFSPAGSAPPLGPESFNGAAGGALGGALNAAAQTRAGSGASAPPANLGGAAPGATSAFDLSTAAGGLSSTAPLPSVGTGASATPSLGGGSGPGSSIGTELSGATPPNLGGAAAGGGSPGVAALGTGANPLQGTSLAQPGLSDLAGAAPSSAFNPTTGVIDPSLSGAPTTTTGSALPSLSGVGTSVGKDVKAGLGLAQLGASLSQGAPSAPPSGGQPQQTATTAPPLSDVVAQLPTPANAFSEASFQPLIDQFLRSQDVQVGSNFAQLGIAGSPMEQVAIGQAEGAATTRANNLLTAFQTAGISPDQQTFMRILSSKIPDSQFSMVLAGQKAA